MKLIEGHWYKFSDRGEEHIGYYIGRVTGFECCVCGKGSAAHCFNVWHSRNGCDYETWGYGMRHLPRGLKDYGVRNDILVDGQEVK